MRFLCAGLASCFEPELLASALGPSLVLGHSRDPDSPHIGSCALGASRLVMEEGVEQTILLAWA